MKILHIVPGLEENGNGIAVVAKLIAGGPNADLVDAQLFVCGECDLTRYEEVWVHSAWLPVVLRSCRRTLRAGKRLVRMSHANYDPLRLKYHGWKKWLVGPIERWCLRRCDRIVATCEAEKGWIKRYLGKKCPPVEVTDIKRFFDLNRVECVAVGNDFDRVERVETCRGEDYVEDGELHLLYLGRRHPLKGIEYLEKAVAELNSNPVNPVNPVQKTSTRSTRLKTSASQRLCVKIISNAYGEELEKVWAWCDVLVLPTLSENFGLVIAEALERGKRVITTDGAPAWRDGLTGLTGFTGLYSGYDGRLIYLKGYRDGTPQERVRLLQCAIAALVSGLTSK